MKTTFMAIELVSLLPLAAQDTKAEETETQNPDESVPRTVETTTFDSDARAKVIDYFDGYRTERFGLPPDWAPLVHAKKIPDPWRT